MPLPKSALRAPSLGARAGWLLARGRGRSASPTSTASDLPWHCPPRLMSFFAHSYVQDLA